MVQTPAPKAATVYILSPADGAVLTNPVTVVFGLRGMGVAPAGVAHKNTGHHHHLIDVDMVTIDLAEELGADAFVRHFDGGETEATLKLSPGAHTLRLVLGDANHVPHAPPVFSKPVTITLR